MGRPVFASVIASCLVSSSVTLALVTFAMPAVGAAQQQEVAAERYLLLGPDGARQGRWLARVNPQSGGPAPFFSLEDDSTVARASLGVGGRGPDSVGLSMRDRRGSVRIHLGLATGVEIDSVGEATAMNFSDEEGRTRLHIGVDPDGASIIKLYDASGELVWSAP